MRCRVLGPVEVIGDAGPVALGGPKQRATFALLAARAGDPVSTDALIDQLWGDWPPGRPRKTLQVYVANLRKALGPAANRLRSEPAGYRLAVRRDEVDALRFEDLVERARLLRVGAPASAAAAYREALALWRGEPFADLADQEALVPLAVRLQELRLAAAEERAEVELDLGLVAEAVGDLQELTGRYPLRERLWVLLMDGLYRQGRQSEALRAFQRVRSHLIEELGVEPSAELQAAEARILQQQPAGASGASPAPSKSTGERRQLSVLCVAMGGIDSDDPEDVAEAIRTFRLAVAEVVGEHGGVVADVRDDRAVGYFGHPVAADDDPLQAVRAGLALVTRVEGSAGVATGTVLMTLDPDAVVEAIGDAPVLAARLQAEAGPGDLLVSEETGMILRGAFELEALAGRRIRRGRGDVGVIRVVRPTGVSNGMLGGGGQVPLVGRDDLLDELVDRARTEGGAIVVAGPPGIGKSALVAAAAERLRALGWAVSTFRCSRRRLGVALHPFLPMLDFQTQAAADEAGPGAQEPGRRVEAVLAALGTQAGARPQLVVVEDIHDADPSTRALLGELGSRGGSGALIVTTRADDGGPGLDGTSDHLVPLEPLDRQAGRRLVRLRAGGRPLGAAVVNEIVDRSGGVPLFIGELTAATVAAAEASDSWREVEVDEVPSSLQASLIGRLDRLGQLKTTAQRCAAVGGEFDVDTASLVVGRERRVVMAELDVLVDEGVLTRGGPGAYRFAHPLLEEAAYQSLLRPERAAIHARLADHFSSLPAAPADVRAVHLDAAGRHAEAARFWCRAARAAIQRSELSEAAAIARRALTAVSHLDAGEESDRLERRALMLLTVARVMSLSGNEELTAAADRLRSLARSAADDFQYGSASVLLISSLQALGEYARAERTAEETISVVGGRVAPELDRLLEHFLGATWVWQGRIDDGYRLLEPLVAEAPAPPLSGHYDVPTVTGVCSLWSLVALVDVVQDRADLSEVRFGVATRFAIESEVPQALCLTRSTQAIARQLVGDADGVYTLAEPTLDLAVELGDDWWVVWAQILLGWSIAVAARDASGVAMIDEALAHLGPLRQLVPYFHGLHGAALGAVDQATDGIVAVHRGLELAAVTGERFFVPVLHGIEAELLAMTGARIDVG